MQEITDEKWQLIQHGIDQCRTCLNESLFDPSRPPARPWNPVCRGRLLLIAEAPPPNGGFWQSDTHDDLRNNLLGFLLPADQALDLFLSRNFFLVHAIKWPFTVKNGENRYSFNSIPRPTDKTKVARHSAKAHLVEEVVAIAPRGILAMGNAATRVCAELSDTPTDLNTAGVETLRVRASQDYQITIQRTRIPVNVTTLPVARTMRSWHHVQEFQKDVLAFMARVGT